MKSIDKLRRSLQACRRTEKTEKPFDTYWITADACDRLIDGIEREVAELTAQRDRYRKELVAQEERILRLIGAMASRFTELPLDADGEPIRLGDSVEVGGEAGTVVAIELRERGDWNVRVRPSGRDATATFDAESVRRVGAVEGD